MTLLQLAFTYVPAMNVLFHSAPVGVGSWLRVLGVGLVIYAAVEFEKWLVSRGSAPRGLIHDGSHFGSHPGAS